MAATDWTRRARAAARPLERVLFLMAGTVTLLSALINPWSPR